MPRSLTSTSGKPSGPFLLLLLREERDDNSREMATLRRDVASLYEQLSAINHEREASEVARQQAKEQLAKVRHVVCTYVCGLACVVHVLQMFANVSHSTYCAPFLCNWYSAYKSAVCTAFCLLMNDKDFTI